MYFADYKRNILYPQKLIYAAPHMNFHNQINTHAGETRKSGALEHRSSFTHLLVFKFIHKSKKWPIIKYVIIASLSPLLRPSFSADTLSIDVLSVSDLKYRNYDSFFMNLADYPIISDAIAP